MSWGSRFYFCSDVYLHSINMEFLDHDTYTDIITFDYNLGKQVHGEIYISVDRVEENANTYQCAFKEELHRVMIHGVLHLCGFKDKTKEDKERMRSKETYYLSKLIDLSSIINLLRY